MAKPRHKGILSDFSLELGDQTASSYLGCILGHLSGSGLVTSHLKDSDDREEKKKEKITGLLQFPWVDFLRGESF